MGPEFRLLTGIECDILDDGSLDQDEDLLGRLDVVVASVHSQLRSEPEPMTARLLAAVRNPRVDVLGGRGRGGGRLMVAGSGFRHPAVLFGPEAVGKDLVGHALRLEPPRRHTVRVLRVCPGW